MSANPLSRKELASLLARAVAGLESPFDLQVLEMRELIEDLRVAETDLKGESAGDIPDPKFYRTTFTYEVLSEEPIGDCMDLGTLRMIVSEGDCVGRFGEITQTELTGKQAADALSDFGSEPGFFMLNDAGQPVDEDGHRTFRHGITVEEEDDGFIVCLNGQTQYVGELTNPTGEIFGRYFAFADRATADAHAEMLETSLDQSA